MPYNCNLTLGSWSLPDPTAEGGWSPSPVLRAVDTVMADASINSDAFESAIKYSYEIRWRLLTAAEFANVTGAWEQFISSSDTLALNGMNLLAAKTVSREPGNYDLQVEASFINGAYRYDASMRLREV